MVAGTAFVTISSIITRRAVYRRLQWSKPTFFQQNTGHPEQKINGSLEALEALSVATVNLFSWTLFYAGGLLWAFDIGSLEEMRSKLRVRLGITEIEQKDSQEIVGAWVKAAKSFNIKEMQSTSPTGEDGSTKGGSSESSASR
jgi:hypothetical protein